MISGITERLGRQQFYQRLHERDIGTVLIVGLVRNNNYDGYHNYLLNVLCVILLTTFLKL